MPPSQPRAAASCSPEQILRLAAEVLDRTIASAERIPLGWANENWRVTTDAGCQFVIKVGPTELAAKWSATRIAYQRAEALGVPAPRLVNLDTACAAVGGRIVRVLTWVDGRDPEVVLEHPEHIERFFSELGAALRVLHDAQVEAFTSRLDGSAPGFDSWDAYVRYRLPGVVERAARCAAFTRDELNTFEREASALATDVSPDIRPSLCHRDLHLGNLLAGDDGRLAAILDFDTAEAWDRAVDTVKLRWQVFPQYAGAAAAFSQGYFDGEPPPAAWDGRVRLTTLLEMINLIANARLDGDHRYEQTWRGHLATFSGTAQ